MPPKVKKSKNVKITDKSKKSTKTSKKISQKVSQIVKINIGDKSGSGAKSGGGAPTSQPIFMPQLLGFPQVQTSSTPLESFARKSDQEAVSKQINALEKISKEQSKGLKMLQERVFAPQIQIEDDARSDRTRYMPTSIPQGEVPRNINEIAQINNASSFTVQGNNETLLRTPIDEMKERFAPRISINDQSFARPDLHESFQGLDDLDEESVATTVPQAKVVPEAQQADDVIAQIGLLTNINQVGDLQVIRGTPAKNKSYPGQLTLQTLVNEMKRKGYTSNVNISGKTRGQYLDWIKDAFGELPIAEV